MTGMNTNGATLSTHRHKPNPTDRVRELRQLGGKLEGHNQRNNKTGALPTYAHRTTCHRRVRRGLYNTVYGYMALLRARAGRSVRIYGCKAAGGMLENLLALHISWLLRRVFADVQLGLAALLAPLVGDIEGRWVDQEPEAAMRCCGRRRREDGTYL